MNHSFDYYKQIENPIIYLCNPNLRPICALNARDRHCILRFNDLSEITFVVDKTEDLAEKDYNRIRTKRLIYVENIGWFQITSAKEDIEGDVAYKNVTAQSHQAVFKDRGFILEERAYMFYNPNDPEDRLYDSANTAAIPSVIGQLVQQAGIKLAGNLSSDVEPSRDYEKWTVTYISPALKFKANSFAEMYVSDSENNVVRHFEARTDGFAYDFMINDVQSAFEVIFDFDFLNHAIKIKTLDEIIKPTDIYLSFENLVNHITLEENSDDIVTVLNCEGGDLDITTVNPMGTNYIVDFAYYMKEQDEDGNPYPWMSRELIAAIGEWRSIYDAEVEGYSDVVLELQQAYMQQAELADDIQFANLRTTDLKSAIDQYTGAEDKTAAAKISVTVESVNVGTTSLLTASTFGKTAFTEDATITAYDEVPTLTETVITEEAEGVGGETMTTQRTEYAFTLKGNKKSGTAASMVADYIIPPDEDTDPAGCYLYFQDGDTNSYCKLEIASEIAVAKDTSDENGISIPVEDGGTGYVELGSTVFKVTSLDGKIRVYNNTDGKEVTYVSGHSDYFDFDGSRYQFEKSADNYVTVTRFYVSGFTRHTVYAHLVGDDGWLTLWEKKAQSLEKENAEIQADINAVMATISAINEKCNIQKFIKLKSDELYDELFHYWIEGNYTNDNLAADDDTSMADRITLAKELMENARVELKKSAQPTFTFTADVVNFIRLIEFTEFTTQLELGRTVTIEKNDKTCYFPALTAIEFDLDDAESFSLTFSSSARPNETAMTIADLLKEASDVSRTVTSNWADLTDYIKHKENITSLIDEPLNRALRTMQEGMSNQQFVIDTTGILGRRYTDDSQTAFSPEQVRMVNNLLVFTDDNWKTVKTALGKIEGYGYGLAAEVLIGNFLLGDNLLIGSESGNVSITNEGVVVKNGAISIYNNSDRIFYMDDDGNLQLTGYSSSEDIDGAINQVRIDFATADGALKSEISSTYLTKADAEKTYQTETQVSSLISQSAESILSTVSKTYTSQDSFNEAVSKINQTADSISGTVTKIQTDLGDYAKKEDSSQSFSYELTAEAFRLISNENTVLEVSGDKAEIFGFTIGEDSIYNGRISLDDSKNEGIYIGTDGVSLGIDENGTAKIIMTKDGSFYASEATITGHINAVGDINTTALYGDLVSVKQVVTPDISIGVEEGIITGGSGTKINFNYSTGAETEWVTATLSEGKSEYGIDNGILTINCDKRLTAAKTLTIYYSVSHILWYEVKSCSVTIPKGASSVSYNTNASLGSNGDHDFGFDEDRTTITTNFTQPVGDEINFGFTGNLLPENFGATIGSTNKKWDYAYFDNLSVTNINGWPYEPNISDIRLKEDIELLSQDLSEKFIYGLEPTSYKFKGNKTPRLRLGFIAQKVEELLKSLGLTSADVAIVNKLHPELPDDDEANIYSLNYLNMIAPMVKVIQSQNERIKLLEKFVNSQSCNSHISADKNNKGL